MTGDNVITAKDQLREIAAANLSITERNRFDSAFDSKDMNAAKDVLIEAVDRRYHAGRLTLNEVHGICSVLGRTYHDTMNMNRSAVA